eukprot:3219280-Pyramimonas_sp.AAC.1
MQLVILEASGPQPWKNSLFDTGRRDRSLRKGHKAGATGLPREARDVGIVRLRGGLLADVES